MTFLAINVSGRDPRIIDALCDFSKSIETRGRTTGYYERLKGLWIALVKTGTNDPDNGHAFALAHVYDVIDMRGENVKKALQHMTRLDPDSPYWENQTGLYFDTVQVLEQPEKVHVYPSCYYSVELPYEIWSAK